ncbi:BTAD domain-containing putative transcriptional regulator [Nonomuraea ferruginea]
MLARLIVAGGRAVPVNTLIDELWPGDPPAQALSTIQGYVSRLRRVLEPGRAPREEASVLVSAPPGYALRARPEQVDTWRFERLAKSDGPPGEVWAAMDGALALWRGPALAEFADLTWAATEAARLEELRLVAIERRGAAGLALGSPTALVADLEAHAAAHPLREEAWRLLALALYRTGRAGRRARRAAPRPRGLAGRTGPGPHGGVAAAGARHALPDPAGHPADPPWRTGPPPTRSPRPPPAARPCGCSSPTTRRWYAPGSRSCWPRRRGLEAAGEAGDGEEAIAAARALRPDVVLLDIQMPNLDGLAAARRILTAADPPKVIMMTTFGSDENLYAALRAGVSGFMLKTSPPEQLVAAIRAAAAGDALIDPAVTTRLISAFAGRTDPASPPALAGLTDAQLDVLKLVARGLTNRQIGQTLAMPEPEVQGTVRTLLDNLGLFERAQLVVAAYESGLVTPGSIAAK